MVDELMALCDQLEAARQQREQGRERLVAATLQRLNQPAEDPASFHKDASFALQLLPSLTTTPAQIKQLRQTILNLAVRGKLVEQDPEDEPAEELLACFAEAKVKQKKRTGDARIKLEDDPSPDALPMTLPVGWKCQSFQNLFLFIDYRGNTPTKTVEGVPLITAKNVRMGRLDLEPREFVSQSTYESWMTRGYPDLGDIFFTTEAPLGNVCLNNIEQPFALAQRVICFQPYAFICTRFIVFALMSDLMQTMIDVHATGMTAKGIKAAKLKPLPIPLPPLAEQHRIVAKVDELMALCDQLEQQLSQADQQRRRLLEAVVAEALLEPEKTLEAVYA
jgi:type I restriction enzyme S subunit